MTNKKSLQFQHELFDRLVEQVPTGILLVSFDGTITKINASAARLLGYSPHELLHRHLKEMVCPLDLQVHQQHVEQVQEATPHDKPHMLRLIHREGHPIWVLVNVSVMNGCGGESCFLYNLMDISAHLLYEQQYRLLTEHSVDVITRHKPDGSYTFVSASCKSHLGYEPDEMRSIFPYDIFHPEDIPLIMESHGNILKDLQMTNCVYRILHKDGIYVWFESVGKAIKNEKGEVTELLLFSRNISDRMQTEQLLRKAEQLSVLGELAAGIAHEIRNPLTTIKGFISLMKESSSGKYSQYHDILLSEIERIEEITNEFLMVAKPQAVSFQKADIVSLVKAASKLLEPQATLNNVQIEVKTDFDPEYIYGEGNHLKQAFTNIIKNAIEALPDGGTVRIKLSRTNDGQAVITINDDGCGIPADRLAHLGEPFYSLKGKGTGLGLMICFKIVKEHNGTIQIESRVNEGTTVTVKLPIQQ
ncbi:PAS domain S-box protein [Paenibacillus sp.]|uniref:PAS domain-containing sensor histidine kinase n=1 Tax=Paenibacillus sp. TaxID=58172 RepID=UPI002D5300BF|nr:PAS domain S-box protein [Paenibacillus sp.]HZG87920.1 PAS domain S-box protein [Paenibacillus sp.]